MLVLDSLRQTTKFEIEIPPFHTGHLGFVPNTTVHVGFLARRAQGASPCELIVTPYQQSRGDLTLLECTLRDEPGVVRKVIEVVSAFHINIVLQNSLSIDYQQRHHVSLLLDWSQSNYPNSEHQASTLRTRRIYAPYAALFPLEDMRYVALFEAIVANCLHDLHFDNVGHALLPAVRLTPVLLPYAQEPAPATIRSKPLKGRESTTSNEERAESRASGGSAEKAEPKSLTKVFAIPENLRDPVRLSRGLQRKEPLSYIIASETESKMLRVLFPDPKKVNAVIHVGIHHQNHAGALDAILKAVHGAGFNIWTSLLRQGHQGENVWEALLENKNFEQDRERGTEIVKSALDYRDLTELEAEQLLDELAKKLLADATAVDKQLLREFGVRLQYPLYPKFKNLSEVQRTIAASIAEDVKARQPPMEINSEWFEDKLNESSLDKAPNGNVLERKKLRDSVRVRVRSDAPTVGVFCSPSGNEHARLLVDRLRENRFEADQLTDGLSTLVQAEAPVEANWDMVVGILVQRPEEVRRNAFFLLSVGVAASRKIPCIVLLPDNLKDEWFFGEFVNAIEIVTFSDLRFIENTLEVVAAKCRDKLMLSH
jgi:hypothetical protein